MLLQANPQCRGGHGCEPKLKTMAARQSQSWRRPRGVRRRRRPRTAQHQAPGPVRRTLCGRAGCHSPWRPHRRRHAMAKGTQHYTQVTPEISGGHAAKLLDQAKPPQTGPPRGVEPRPAADVVPPWSSKTMLASPYGNLAGTNRDSRVIGFPGNRADWTTNPARNLGRDSQQIVRFS